MDKVPPQLELAFFIAGELLDAAEALARKTRRKSGPPRRGQTLRPGADTPLWNQLAEAVAREPLGYGDKAKLGRLLGVPRQRVQDYFVSRRAMPDAERTLRLLQWLAARRIGRSEV